MALFTFYKKAEPILKELSIEEVKQMLADAKSQREELLTKQRYIENWKTKDLKRHINIIEKYINNVSNKEQDSNLEQLVETLINSTQQLYKSYLNKVEEWGNTNYERMIEKSKYDHLDWVAYIPTKRNSDKPVEVFKYKSKISGKEELIPYRMFSLYEPAKKAYFNNEVFDSNEYIQQSEDSRKAETKVKNFIYLWKTKRTKQDYIDSLIKTAQDKYLNDINRLAKRIRSKGLDETNLKIKESKIDSNSIDAYITDGKQEVYARSIFVDGYIQEPHYRYIIT